MSFVLGFFLEATLGMMRLLVPGGQFAAVHLHAIELLLLRAHVSASTCCRACGERSSSRFRCNTWPIFPPPCFLARSTGAELAWGLALQFAWTVFFIVASRIIFHLGTRHYSGLATRRVDHESKTTHDREQLLRSIIPHDLSPRLSDLRPQQPGARHDVPREFSHRHRSSSVVVGVHQLGFYTLIFRYHAGHRRGHGLGEISVLSLSRHGPVDQ